MHAYVHICRHTYIHTLSRSSVTPSRSHPAHPLREYYMLTVRLPHLSSTCSKLGFEMNLHNEALVALTSLSVVRSWQELSVQLRQLLPGKRGPKFVP